MAQARSLSGQTPADITGLGKASERRNVSKEQTTGADSGRVSPQIATPTTNPLVAAVLVVEPTTSVIVVEDEHHYAVAVSIPLPGTPDNSTAFAPATVPAAPAKP